jgi:hypothetical protein
VTLCSFLGTHQHFGDIAVFIFKVRTPLSLVHLREIVTEVLINLIIRIRTRYFRHAYPHTRDILVSEVGGSDRIGFIGSGYDREYVTISFQMHKMIRQPDDTTKLYFYYATCFGHIGTIIRQFQYMNTTVIEDHQYGSILVRIGHMM